MKLLKLVSLVNLVALAWACPGEEHDDHDHSHSKRAFPSTTLTRPTRPLEWGDINFIHTTDSHGWLLGHQKLSFPEPNYRYARPFLTVMTGVLTIEDVSGDLGDFSSFVHHMKDLALVRSALLELTKNFPETHL